LVKSGLCHAVSCIDANGARIVKAGDEEQLVYVEVDLSASEKIRKSRPYTGLRRREFYR